VGTTLQGAKLVLLPIGVGGVNHLHQSWEVGDMRLGMWLFLLDCCYFFSLSCARVFVSLFFKIFFSIYLFYKIVFK
jgi:heme/copper-type cytochrome/quinol oxidase subunit 3